MHIPCVAHGHVYVSAAVLVRSFSFAPVHVVMQAEIIIYHNNLGLNRLHVETIPMKIIIISYHRKKLTM